MAANNTVWFVAEVQQGELAPVSRGLASEARRLAQRLGTGSAALVLGRDVRGLAPSIAADTVFAVEHPLLSEHSSEAHCLAAAGAVRDQGPAILLLAATPFGRDLAARLAARLGAGLAPGCLRLDLGSDGVLLMVRPAYGGRASCTVVCPSARPQMATMLPESLPGQAAAAGPAPQVISVEAELSGFSPRLALEGVQRPEPDSLDVGEADVLVAGGRGVGGAEGFDRLRELAAWLGGSVAASRPAVDASWAPYRRQVGASGRMVAPRLYIACGISGASQHVVGMRDSATIVAVNQDRYAPIVKMADLALIGDLREVVPVVIERLRTVTEPPAREERTEARADAPGGPGDGPLRIAVCLSLCLDPERPLEFRRGGGFEAPADGWLLNAADLHALEEGLRLKDARPGSRLVALTMGPTRAEGLLRDALALGADEAVLVWEDGFAGSDSLASARVLEAALRRVGAGAVLCGCRNPDGDTGQLPLQLGELLGWPVLSRVVEMSLHSGGARVSCRWEGGRRATYRASLPAVLAVEPGINRPRYAPLRERLRAAHRPVARWGLGELGLRGSQVGESGSGLRLLSVGPPKPVARGLFVPDESLSAEERWQQLLSGGVARQQDNVLTGPPDYLAEQMVRFLLERGFARAKSPGAP